MANRPQYRKTVRQTSLHKRPGALHAADMVQLSHLNTSIPFFMLFSEAKKNPELLLDDATEASVGDNVGEKEAADMEIFMLHSACEREELLSVRHVERPLVISLTRTIASIDKCDAYHKYRVLKADMPRLRRALGFPEWVTLANGSVFTGEEAFLLLLMRMGYVALLGFWQSRTAFGRRWCYRRYPGRLADLGVYFGREYSQLPRLSRWATDFMFERHSFRVMDNLNFWASHLRAFGRAVYRKGRAFRLEYDDICGFIDGTLRDSAALTVTETSREVYDGHHRDHGLAYQAVMAPHGMLIDAWGPVRGCRHDAYLLRVSDLNPRLAAVQDPDGPQMKVYGDTAYPLLSHVRRGFKGSNLTDPRKAFNKANNKLGISVEWGFGKVTQLFPFCDFRKNQKLFLQPVGKYYINACVLTNAHTCLRGSQTGGYFDMTPPTLEEYFSWVDVVRRTCRRRERGLRLA